MNFDYILILGGPVKGDLPSELLFERIKCASEFYFENEDIKIVASGGIKGRHQRLSEACIIKNSLVELGVPPEDIILENKALTTLENFLYTKKIVGESAAVTYVTNKFHIYRCTLIAQRAGVDYVPMSAPDGKRSLSFRIRERFILPFAKHGIIK